MAAGPAGEFEEQRARLFGLAYRLLGSAADAEDVVQDTYVRWSGADRAAIVALPVWLARVATNLCLNRLASARVNREARGCAALARLPVLPVPAATSLQTVDAGAVAARLAELATSTPSGRVSDMAGPQVRAAADLARSYLRASGRYRRVQPVWLPGRAAAALRRGANLAPGRACGRVTFEEFLGGQR